MLVSTVVPLLKSHKEKLTQGISFLMVWLLKMEVYLVPLWILHGSGSFLSEVEGTNPASKHDWSVPFVRGRLGNYLF